MTNKPQTEPEKSYALSRHQETVKLFESKSDQEVWNAFNTGDEMAFNYLFRVYTPILFRYGCQFKVEEAQVEDAIQNLFIYLRKRRGELSSVTSIKAYLFKSLQRELVRIIKSDKNKIQLVGDELEAIFPLELSTENYMIQDETNHELMAKLKSAIDRLTPRQKQAILLLYEEGMSYKDISEVMDFAEVKTARKLIYRAIDALREFMANN